MDKQNFGFSADSLNLREKTPGFQPGEVYKLEVRSCEAGQALLEVLVALAISILIVSAFVSLGMLSVRNSTFSNNRARATQLAQEGLEAMISIRDQNAPGAIQNFTVDQWVEFYVSPSVLGSCATPANLTDATCTDFRLAPCSADPLLIGQHCIARGTETYDNVAWRLAAPDAQFSRKIRVTKTGVAAEALTIKDVTVFVWWNDASGRHESMLSRKLYREPLR